MRDEVVYLLGAGASKDAGLPLAVELTQLVDEDLAADKSTDGQRLSHILKYVIDRISRHVAATTGGPASVPDIETVVSTVELLRDYETFELSPFVREWDPGLRAALTDARDETELEAKIARAAADGDDITEKYLREALALVKGGALGGLRLSGLLPRLYASLVRILQTPDGPAVDYLAPLVALGDAPNGVTVATLNYDRTIEVEAGRAAVAVDAAVDRWELDGQLRLPDTGVRLLKLHGSIDWVRGAFVPGRGTPGISTTALEFGPFEADDVPFLIFGRREKLRPEGPFLALRAEFERRLRACRCLVAVGYSFADDHVNELIAQWINTDPRRQLVVVDPGFPRSSPEAKGFTQLVYSQLSPWGMPGPNRAGGRLWVLREGASKALPVVAHTSVTEVLKRVRARVGVV